MKRCFGYGARFLSGLCGSVALGAGSAHAQSKAMCTRFFDAQSKIHTKVECIEALFSEPKWHFTFSGLPPGNGFGVGGMYDRETDYVSPSQKVSSTDFKAAIIGTVNGSWQAIGSADLTPPLYTPDRRKAGETCQRLDVLCTKTQFSTHLLGTYRSVQAVSFYGLGPRSAAIKHTFHQNDTFGVMGANLPLTDHIAVEGGVEILQPELPPTSDPLSVSKNFNDATAPGLQSQPTFVHPHVALVTVARALSNPQSDDRPQNHAGPLMKRHMLFTFNNDGEYHWYAAMSDSPSSFQQFVAKGDEVLELGSNVRRYVTVEDVGNGMGRRLLYYILQGACGDGHERLKDPKAYVLKVTQQCNYGRIDLRAQMKASTTAAGSVIPFYLQPTIGGSDINSQLSLRGYPDYRFRDRDAVFTQAEYTLPIYDPVGLLLFYDAGTVGRTFSSLSFGHLRQDAGLGTVFRLQGKIVAQAYLAWGAGHGTTLGYNFSKLF
jgi:hypothetical protein